MFFHSRGIACYMASGFLIASSEECVSKSKPVEDSELFEQATVFIIPEINVI